MNQHERRLARQKETISAKKEERTMSERVEETKIVEKKADTPKSKKRRKRWSAQEVAKAVMQYYTEHKKLPPIRRTEKELGLPSYVVIRRELGNNRNKWLDTASAILNDEPSVQRLQSIEDLTELLREGGALEAVIKMIGPIELNVAYQYKLAGTSFLIMIKAEK